VKLAWYNVVAGQEMLTSSYTGYQPFLLLVAVSMMLQLQKGFLKL
jgi:hypothetical protein